MRIAVMQAQETGLKELAMAAGGAVLVILLLTLLVQQLNRRSRQTGNRRRAARAALAVQGSASQVTTRLDPIALPLLQPAMANVAAGAPDVPMIGPIQIKPIEERKHTVGASTTGSGKSTTMYTLVVYDLARGVHPIVCSPQFAPFHPDHQKIDLRPLVGRFEVARKGEEIRAAIDAVVGLIEQRYDRYYHGHNPGEHVALYLGEWEEIVRMCGAQVVELVARIAEQGRILHLWIGFMELHDGLVKSFGGDSGFRKAFPTRLVGVDQDETTWRTMIGKKIGPLQVPKYHWAIADGNSGVAFTPVYPPRAEDIVELSRRPMPTWQPLIRHQPARPDLRMTEAELRTVTLPQRTRARALWPPVEEAQEVRQPVRTVETGSQPRTALDSPRTEFEEVRPPTITPAIAAFIGRELGSGTSPSKVAKKIPGYRADQYDKFKAMVDLVVNMTGEHVAPEEDQSEN